jgi:hypothetical protein
MCIIAVALCALGGPTVDAGKEGGGLKVDKDKRTITIDAKIAPRKLAHLKEVYPIEVIACWEHPKGKKAHETVVTIDANPSSVHKALESLGLKPGTPVMGESKNEPAGPEVNLFLEVPGVGDETRKLTMDKVLVDSRTGKPFPKSTKFRFTGSVMEQPDPAKKDKVYGADTSGTLIVVFPVSNLTVFQTNWTMKEERFMKLETNTKNLPKEGTPVKLVIEVPSK